MQQAPVIRLLDCTLRDASYQLGFRFTAADTAALSGALDNAGFPEIEVGHGLGLGGSRQPNCGAAATDDEYVEAARSAVTNARLGVFAIPHIASLDDVRSAARRGIDYIRIGVDSSQPTAAEKHVKFSQDQGVVAYVFFMQSTLVSPDALGESAALASGWGVSTIHVVDSAGSMLPEDVTRYVSAVRDRADVTIGFHGHNNLHLAMANVIAAIKAGATIIDCTLRGMGRSAGNAQTEAVALVVKRLGYVTGVDIPMSIQIADEYIESRLPGYGNDGIDLAVGFAGLHSRYLNDVNRIAAEYNVEPVELLLFAGEQGHTNNRTEFLAEIAQSMKTPA